MGGIGEIIYKINMIYCREFNALQDLLILIRLGSTRIVYTSRAVWQDICTGTFAHCYKFGTQFLRCDSLVAYLETWVC